MAIELGKLQPRDVRRGVVYAPRAGAREDGTISSWNSRFVFVRYRGDAHAKATDPREIEWLAADDATGGR